MSRLPWLASIPIVIAGCRGNPTATPVEPPPTAARAVAEPAASAPQAPSLSFEAPAQWVSVTPKSSMRKEQWSLPRAEGDGEDAELVVYYFGPSQGGGIEANVQRWCAQFEQPDGSPTEGVLKGSSRTVNGLHVDEVALSGTYVAETAPGSGERVHKPGFRMLAAIVHTGHGPYYVKLTGPAATVARWERDYEEYVSSAKER
jgi:hypothetical protein